MIGQVGCWIYWPDISLPRAILIVEPCVYPWRCVPLQQGQKGSSSQENPTSLLSFSNFLQCYIHDFQHISTKFSYSSKTGLMMWDHSYSRQHSGTMGLVQAAHSPPSLCSQPNFSNMSDVPSPPQHTSCSKLGGLLSKFKPHFDRIRNWRCNKGSALRLLLWHTAGMSVWEWAAMETSWQRLSLFAGQV